jgi:hypothetical protein
MLGSVQEPSEAAQSISEQKNLDKQYGVVYSNGVRTGHMALAMLRVVTPPLATALEGLFWRFT